MAENNKSSILPPILFPNSKAYLLRSKDTDVSIEETAEKKLSILQYYLNYIIIYVTYD